MTANLHMPKSSNHPEPQPHKIAGSNGAHQHGTSAQRTSEDGHAQRRRATGLGVEQVDMPRLTDAVHEILLAVGEDPDRPGLRDTPHRVARAYAELFSGLHRSPAVHLNRVFHQRSDEAVLVRDITFHSLCEHHLLPMFGKVHIAYLPSDGKVVGLSKLARTVEVYALRPQMQERLTEQIADALATHLEARGVAVIIEGEHFCMKMRGVKQTNATTITSAFRGDLAEDANLKAVTVGLLHPDAHGDAQQTANTQTL